MQHRYALLPLTLASALGTFAQYWYQRANFPSIVYAPYGFSIGDRVFAGGGITSTAPFTEYAGFNEYLPATDTWVSRTPCPGPLRYGVSGFGLNGKGYVVCGWSGSPATQLRDMWEYDPVADSWIQKNDFPGSARYSCVSVSVNGKAYLGLGHATYLSDWWEYDPGTDTWTQRASLPALGRQANAAFVIGDDVYVTVGARDVGTLTANFLYDLFRYSPATDTWTSLAPFPATGRVGGYAFSYSGVGYVFCGTTGDASGHYILNDGWAYRPSTDEWYQLGLFPGVPMSAGFACSTGTTCYIGGGNTGIDDFSWLSLDYTNAFWEYHPEGLNGLNELQASDDMRVISTADGMLVQWLATAGVMHMHLIDEGGRVVRAQVLEGRGEQAFCPTAGLADGLYVVQLTGDAFAARRKVMVSR